MQNFTPYSSLIGGVLIGLGAAAMLIFEGRIAGISGMLDGLLRPTKGDTAWKAWFIAGLVAGELLLRAYDILRHNGIDIGKRDYLSSVAKYIRPQSVNA